MTTTCYFGVQRPLPAVLTSMLLLLLLLLLMLPTTTTASSFGIPGTTQTSSGYDTETGTDPICWRSTAAAQQQQAGTNSNEGLAFPNPLIADFKLAGQVELLQECPVGNILNAVAPAEHTVEGERLRTGQLYHYKVTLSLNLDSLAGNVLVSDEGSVIAVQVLLCKLGCGFCSPFIHEEANARLAALGITTPPAKGDSHGGTHTHSGFSLVKLNPDDGPVYSTTVKVPMLVNTPGDYFAISAAQLYVGNNNRTNNSSTTTTTTTAEYRYDIANALQGDDRLLTYQDPAEILLIPDGVLIASYICIGISSSIVFFLLAQTIKHRNHQVLRLTQGSFLIVFLIAALVMCTCSFLLQPVSDAYCNAAFPVLLIAAQLMYAISFGRLWRINAVISPLLMQTLRQKKGWTATFMGILKKVTSLQCLSSCLPSGSGKKPKNLRKQISPWQLSLVVALFAAPQVIIQICSVVFQPQTLELALNGDESKGRYMCESGVPVKASLTYWGFFLFCILVLLLLFMAQTTRQLPSLFNETKVILETASFSFTLLVLGLAIILVTDGPTTSPAVGYIVCLFWTLSIAVMTSYRIMMPKLRMVWRDEKVVVSRLVSDHARTVRATDADRASQISGLCRPEGRSSVTARHSSSQEVEDGMRDSQDPSFSERAHLELLDDDESPATDATDQEAGSGGSSSEFAGGALQPSLRPMPRNEDSVKRRLGSLPSRRHLRNHIVIASDEAPARRLVLKMVDLQRQLASINERIMMGMAISEEEWATVRRLTNRLGTVFTNEVEFSWERVAPSDTQAPLIPQQSSDRHNLSREMIVEEDPGQGEDLTTERFDVDCFVEEKPAEAVPGKQDTESEDKQDTESSDTNDHLV